MAEKYRYWVFLIYPESAPEDWRERLRASHGAFAASPLHVPDESETKPHYHVLYKHSGPITLDAARAFLVPLGVAANGYIEPCQNPRNYQRYLVHLDDPEKQQWAEDWHGLIWSCGGFPLDLTRDFSPAERAEQRRMIFELIRDNGVTEYAQLLDGLMEIGEVDLLDYACNHTIMFDRYLSSRRHSYQLKRSQQRYAGYDSYDPDERDESEEWE